MKQWIRPEILAMQPYTPILPFEVLSAQLGRPIEEIVKLDANENPYGPSPKAMEALQQGAFYHIYPDPSATLLREKLGAFLQLPSERLLAGLGADELIDLILRAVISPDDVVIDCPPTFGMYHFSADVNGAKLVTVWRNPDFSLDVEGIERAVADSPNAKVLFLCSPNNPDGSVIDDETLRRLLALPLLVVLDEAYVDFSALDGRPTRMAWALQYDNLVILRTFSKLAGLAGLRIGYGIFPLWLIPHLFKIKQPYNVTVAGELAARGAMEDEAWLVEKVALMVTERKRMVALLEPFDFLRPYPSYSNFVLFQVIGRNAFELKKRLEQEGVLVRHFAKRGVDNCIRISVGRPEQTERLIAALHNITTE